MNTETTLGVILNYLTNDKTNSALMLTAPWGSGKSYFINHTLQENFNNDLIIISLYGLNDLTELSKSIYLELRLKLFKLRKFAKKRNVKHLPEVYATGKIIGKSIIKSVISLFSLNFDISDNDLKKLYKSIDLTGKLLVFEDIERSQIDLIELMGFVNNLVVQDNAKVLIVANEEEILRLTKEKDTYERVKEKTINDTILFECDYELAVKNIIAEFNNDILKLVTDEISIKEIVGIFKEVNIYNLRSFKYACQKTIEIFDYLKENHDLNFKKALFYGNIAFCLKYKNGENLILKNNNELLYDMGTRKYPLYMFCYLYIVFHNVIEDKLNNIYEIYNEKELYDKYKSINDEDVNIIRNFYTESDIQVKQAINNLCEKLNDINNVSFFLYDELIVNLFNIQDILNVNIEDLKNKILINLGKCKVRILSLYHLKNINKFSNKTIEQEFNEYIDKINQILKKNEIERVNDFSDFSEWCDFVTSNTEKFHDGSGFLNHIQIEKVYELLENSTAKIIYDIRTVFSAIYKNGGNIIFQYDIAKLKNILNRINEFINNGIFDKIHQFQFSLFKNELSYYINSLTQ